MNNRHNNISPQAITVAREYNKLSQKELAEKMGIAQTEISKMENGLREITKEKLYLLVEVLQFPVNFFFEDYSIYTSDLRMHRKRQSIANKEINYVDRLISIYEVHIRKLLKEVEIKNNIPFIDLEDYDSPEEIAIEVRKIWNVLSGPITNLIELIEKNGCIVIQCSSSVEKFDGVSFAFHDDDKMLPIILINADMLGDRQRFTLAHELGHLVMHKFFYPEAEDEANRFASEFLMPEKDIKKELNNITLRKVAPLKGVWKVSMAALIKRAGDLKTITKKKSTSLWIQLSKYGYRKREPQTLDIPAEMPTLLGSLVDYQLEKFDYDFEKFIDYLGIDKKLFKELYLNNRKRIRIG